MIGDHLPGSISSPAEPRLRYRIPRRGSGDLEIVIPRPGAGGGSGGDVLLSTREQRNCTRKSLEKFVLKERRSDQTRPGVGSPVCPGREPGAASVSGAAGCWLVRGAGKGYAPAALPGGWRAGGGPETEPELHQPCCLGSVAGVWGGKTGCRLPPEPHPARLGVLSQHPASAPRGTRPLCLEAALPRCTQEPVNKEKKSRCGPGRWP